MKRQWPSLVAFALTLACLAVFWSYATPHLCYPRYWHPGDAGHGTYNAWQVATGRVLYQDIFEYRFPLFFFVYGPFLQLTGKSLLALQGATLVPLALAAALLALAIRRVGGAGWFAALGGPLPVLLTFAVWPFPYPPWLAWPFVAGAIAVLARDVTDRGALARAGVLTGLAGLTLQAQGVPFAIGVTLGLFALARGRRLATAGWFAAGGLLAIVPFAVYFAAHGALADLVWNTYVWPTKHYYNGAISGTGLFAGVREHFQRRGFCQVGALSRLYDASVLGLSVVPTLGAIAASASLFSMALRRQADVFLGALAAGALAAYLPNLKPEMSDNPHFAFASLAPTAVLLVLAARSGWLARGLVVLATLGLVVIHVDRARRFHPFQARYLDFDAYAARYWKVQPLIDLTEPGDRIVHLPYGGWEYLLSGRESGLPHTWMFADYRMIPEPEFRRATRVLAERDPALLVFTEKSIERFLFRADPTLPERYFWNGFAWERRGLPHDPLATAYGALSLTQDGNRLSGQLDGKALVGSIRGRRVYLNGPGEELWLRLAPDGTLAGRRNGRPFSAAPGSAAP